MPADSLPLLTTQQTASQQMSITGEAAVEEGLGSISLQSPSPLTASSTADPNLVLFDFGTT